MEVDVANPQKKKIHKSKRNLPYFLSNSCHGCVVSSENVDQVK